MKEYLAIDNVCAWPNLTLLPNGDISATLFNQPCHGKWEGCIESWVSQDQGVSWKYCSSPTPNLPRTNRMNHAAGIAHNQDFIVISGGWSNIPSIRDPDSEEIRTFDRTECSVLDATVARSSDGGLTWSAVGHIEYCERDDKRRTPLVPYGDIFQFPNNTLACCFYDGILDSDDDKTCRGSAYLLKSYDDGKSWGDPQKIGDNMQNETCFYPITSEHLLAASRSFVDGHLDCFKSFDSGRSWQSSLPQLTGPGQAPGHIQRLQSGILLLTYGVRASGLYGIGARMSEDNGENWNRPCLIASLEDAYDGGYPSTLELENGTLVTAYYSGPNKIHHRYHMKTLHWTIEEAIMKNRDLISKLNEQ